MKKKNLDALFKELRVYLNAFPYDYADRVFEIFSELSPAPGRSKDSVLTSFLDIIGKKTNSKGQLLLDYVHIFERLFFFLSDEKLKEKYSKVLLDVYLVRFSDNEKKYKRKIHAMQEFLGLNYVHVLEHIFFSLSDKKLQEGYSKLLLDIYLVRFSDDEKKYKKKIEELQKFLGKGLTDIPQFKKEKLFLSLHLGSKKIFAIISALLSGKK